MSVIFRPARSIVQRNKAEPRGKRGRNEKDITLTRVIGRENNWISFGNIFSSYISCPAYGIEPGKSNTTLPSINKWIYIKSAVVCVTRINF